MLLSGEPLTIIVIAKVFAHWLTTGIPLTVISGLLALMFDLETDVALVLMSALFIGTPVLSLVGSVGAALTLGLRFCRFMFRFLFSARVPLKQSRSEFPRPLISLSSAR